MMTRYLLPAAALLSAALLAACSDVAATPEETLRTARIETVAAPTGLARREFVGRVEARYSVDLAFQVSGRLAEFAIPEGQMVQEGTLIARLEDQDYERALREARVQLQQARTNLDRQQTLHERGIASDAALEDARTAFELRSVALDTMRQNLSYATIEAPFTGLMSRRLVDNFTTLNVGQPVARLQDLSELRVAIAVPESLIATLERPDSYTISARFPFMADREFPLEFRELIAEPDTASQTYKVMFALPADLPGNILPGMTVNVRVQLDQESLPGGDAVRIPVTALAALPDGGFQVWVFDPHTSSVSARPVRTRGVEGGSVLVLDGVQAGEQIVTAGVSALSEGMRVRPMAPSGAVAQNGAAR
ncbi:RND family efflux transporter MFP subunit [Glycocaulis alkaliphilus]|uniref:RND family efflux transporter MFP subunit n=1 Tax=Glycocaulis alkaliphilus TaxID=1434191 RepID=A0A3T0E6C3_9PROT|nr:efflux RND transporter periplasmic adaptor subunit [Glycocaulis alkaliphilus]AZU02708.1 RND family efflux transporter MFP subunit [Glycocaulis alkaliphilus]GGB79595.1 hemolysin secretion protein D [Glycocaulis alkaliphilus]